MKMDEWTAYFLVKKTYHYNPETGEFINLRYKRVIKVKTNKGYLVAMMRRERFYVHRLIWLYMTGRWPKHLIDHINCDPSDNRWCNLREANVSENARNRVRCKANTTGHKGIHRNRKGYIVRIVIGTYKTLEEAVQVYEKAVKLHHGEFARAR